MESKEGGTGKASLEEKVREYLYCSDEGAEKGEIEIKDATKGKDGYPQHIINALVAKHLATGDIDGLSTMCFGTNMQTLSSMVESAGGGSGVCAYVFQEGEPAYQCLTCGADPTCILCMKCWKNSDHEGHNYVMNNFTGGGCCDCGDPESWDPSGFCRDHHGPDSQQTTLDDFLDEEHAGTTRKVIRALTLRIFASMLPIAGITGQTSGRPEGWQPAETILHTVSPRFRVHEAAYATAEPFLVGDPRVEQSDAGLKWPASLEPSKAKAGVGARMGNWCGCRGRKPRPKPTFSKCGHDMMRLSERTERFAELVQYPSVFALFWTTGDARLPKRTPGWQNVRRFFDKGDRNSVLLLGLFRSREDALKFVAFSGAESPKLVRLLSPYQAVPVQWAAKGLAWLNDLCQLGDCFTNIVCEVLTKSQCSSWCDSHCMNCPGVGAPMTTAWRVGEELFHPCDTLDPMLRRTLDPEGNPDFYRDSSLLEEIISQSPAIRSAFAPAISELLYKCFSSVQFKRNFLRMYIKHYADIQMNLAIDDYSGGLLPPRSISYLGVGGVLRGMVELSVQVLTIPSLAQMIGRESNFYCLIGPAQDLLDVAARPLRISVEKVLELMSLKDSISRMRFMRISAHTDNNGDISHGFFTQQGCFLPHTSLIALGRQIHGDVTYPLPSPHIRRGLLLPDTRFANRTTVSGSPLLDAEYFCAGPIPSSLDAMPSFHVTHSSDNGVLVVPSTAMFSRFAYYFRSQFQRYGHFNVDIQVRFAMRVFRRIGADVMYVLRNKGIGSYLFPIKRSVSMIRPRRFLFTTSGHNFYFFSAWMRMLLLMSDRDQQIKKRCGVESYPSDAWATNFDLSWQVFRISKTCLNIFKLRMRRLLARLLIYDSQDDEKVPFDPEYASEEKHSEKINDTDAFRRFIEFYPPKTLRKVQQHDVLVGIVRSMLEYCTYYSRRLWLLRRGTFRSRVHTKYSEKHFAETLLAGASAAMSWLRSNRRRAIHLTLDHACSVEKKQRRRHECPLEASDHYCDVSTNSGGSSTQDLRVFNSDMVFPLAIAEGAMKGGSTAGERVVAAMENITTLCEDLVSINTTGIVCEPDTPSKQRMLFPYRNIDTELLSFHEPLSAFICSLGHIIAQTLPHTLHAAQASLNGRDFTSDVDAGINVASLFGRVVHKYAGTRICKDEPLTPTPPMQLLRYHPFLDPISDMLTRAAFTAAVRSRLWVRNGEGLHKCVHLYGMTNGFWFRFKKTDRLAVQMGVTMFGPQYMLLMALDRFKLLDGLRHWFDSDEWKWRRQIECEERFPYEAKQSELSEQGLLGQMPVRFASVYNKSRPLYEAWWFRGALEGFPAQPERACDMDIRRSNIQIPSLGSSPGSSDDAFDFAVPLSLRFGHNPDTYHGADGLPSDSKTDPRSSWDHVLKAVSTMKSVPRVRNRARARPLRDAEHVKERLMKLLEACETSKQGVAPRRSARLSARQLPDDSGPMVCVTLGSFPISDMQEQKNVFRDGLRQFMDSVHRQPCSGQTPKSEDLSNIPCGFTTDCKSVSCSHKVADVQRGGVCLVGWSCSQYEKALDAVAIQQRGSVHNISLFWRSRVSPRTSMRIMRAAMNNRQKLLLREPLGKVAFGDLERCPYVGFSSATFNDQPSPCADNRALIDHLEGCLRYSFWQTRSLLGSDVLPGLTDQLTVEDGIGSGYGSVLRAALHFFHVTVDFNSRSIPQAFEALRVTLRSFFRRNVLWKLSSRRLLSSQGWSEEQIDTVVPAADHVQDEVMLALTSLWDECRLLLRAREDITLYRSKILQLLEWNSKWKSMLSEWFSWVISAVVDRSGISRQPTASHVRRYVINILMMGPQTRSQIVAMLPLEYRQWVRQDDSAFMQILQDVTGRSAQGSLTSVTSSNKYGLSREAPMAFSPYHNAYAPNERSNGENGYRAAFRSRMAPGGKLVALNKWYVEGGAGRSGEITADWSGLQLPAWWHFVPEAARRAAGGSVPPADYLKRKIPEDELASYSSAVRSIANVPVSETESDTDFSCMLPVLKPLPLSPFFAFCLPRMLLADALWDAAFSALRMIARLPSRPSKFNLVARPAPGDFGEWVRTMVPNWRPGRTPSPFQSRSSRQYRGQPKSQSKQSASSQESASSKGAHPELYRKVLRRLVAGCEFAQAMKVVSQKLPNGYYHRLFGAWKKKHDLLKANILYDVPVLQGNEQTRKHTTAKLDADASQSEAHNQILKHILYLVCLALSEVSCGGGGHLRRWEDGRMLLHQLSRARDSSEMLATPGGASWENSILGLLAEYHRTYLDSSLEPARKARQNTPKEPDDLQKVVKEVHEHGLCMAVNLKHHAPSLGFVCTQVMSLAVSSDACAADCTAQANRDTDKASRSQTQSDTCEAPWSSPQLPIFPDDTVLPENSVSAESKSSAPADEEKSELDVFERAAALMSMVSSQPQTSSSSTKQESSPNVAPSNAAPAARLSECTDEVPAKFAPLVLKLLENVSSAARQVTQKYDALVRAKELRRTRLAAAQARIRAQMRKRARQYTDTLDEPQSEKKGTSGVPDAETEGSCIMCQQGASRDKGLYLIGLVTPADSIFLATRQSRPLSALSRQWLREARRAKVRARKVARMRALIRGNRSGTGRSRHGPRPALRRAISARRHTSRSRSQRPSSEEHGAFQSRTTAPISLARVPPSSGGLFAEEWDEQGGHFAGTQAAEPVEQHRVVTPAPRSSAATRGPARAGIGRGIQLVRLTRVPGENQETSRISFIVPAGAVGDPFSAMDVLGVNMGANEDGNTPDVTRDGDTNEAPDPEPERPVLSSLSPALRDLDSLLGNRLRRFAERALDSPVNSNIVQTAAVTRAPDASSSEPEPPRTDASQVVGNRATDSSSTASEAGALLRSTSSESSALVRSTSTEASTEGPSGQNNESAASPGPVRNATDGAHPATSGPITSPDSSSASLGILGPPRFGNVRPSSEDRVDGPLAIEILDGTNSSHDDSDSSAMGIGPDGWLPISLAANSSSSDSDFDMDQFAGVGYSEEDQDDAELVMQTGETVGVNGTPESDTGNVDIGPRLGVLGFVGSVMHSLLSRCRSSNSSKKSPPRLHPSLRTLGAVSGGYGGSRFQTCGHLIHEHCFTDYRTSLRDKIRFGSRAARLFKEEFLCPMCKRLSNARLQVFNTSLWEKYSEQDSSEGDEGAAVSGGKPANAVLRLPSPARAVVPPTATSALWTKLSSPLTTAPHRPALSAVLTSNCAVSMSSVFVQLARWQQSPSNFGPQQLHCGSTAVSLSVPEVDGGFVSFVERWVRRPLMAFGRSYFSDDALVCMERWGWRVFKQGAMRVIERFAPFKKQAAFEHKGVEYVYGYEPPRMVSDVCVYNTPMISRQLKALDWYRLQVKGPSKPVPAAGLAYWKLFRARLVHLSSIRQTYPYVMPDTLQRTLWERVAFFSPFLSFATPLLFRPPNMPVPSAWVEGDTDVDQKARSQSSVRRGARRGKHVRTRTRDQPNFWDRRLQFVEATVHQMSALPHEGGKPLDGVRDLQFVTSTDNGGSVRAMVESGAMIAGDMRTAASHDRAQPDIHKRYCHQRMRVESFVGSLQCAEIGARLRVASSADADDDKRALEAWRLRGQPTAPAGDDVGERATTAPTKGVGEGADVSEGKARGEQGAAGREAEGAAGGKKSKKNKKKKKNKKNKKKERTVQSNGGVSQSGGAGVSGASAPNRGYWTTKAIRTACATGKPAALLQMGKGGACAGGSPPGLTSFPIPSCPNSWVLSQVPERSLSHMQTMFRAVRYGLLLGSMQKQPGHQSCLLRSMRVAANVSLCLSFMAQTAWHAVSEGKVALSEHPEALQMPEPLDMVLPVGCDAFLLLSMYTLALPHPRPAKLKWQEISKLSDKTDAPASVSTSDRAASTLERKENDALSPDPMKQQETSVSMALSQFMRGLPAVVPVGGGLMTVNDPEQRQCDEQLRAAQLYQGVWMCYLMHMLQAAAHVYFRFNPEDWTELLRTTTAAAHTAPDGVPSTPSRPGGDPGSDTQLASSLQYVRDSSGTEALTMQHTPPRPRQLRSMPPSSPVGAPTSWTTGSSGSKMETRPLPQTPLGAAGHPQIKAVGGGSGAFGTMEQPGGQALRFLTPLVAMVAKYRSVFEDRVAHPLDDEKNDGKDVGVGGGGGSSSVGGGGVESPRKPFGASPSRKRGSSSLTEDGAHSSRSSASTKIAKSGALPLMRALSDRPVGRRRRKFRRPLPALPEDDEVDSGREGASGSGGAAGAVGSLLTPEPTARQPTASRKLPMTVGAPSRVRDDLLVSRRRAVLGGLGSGRGLAQRSSRKRGRTRVSQVNATQVISCFFRLMLPFLRQACLLMVSARANLHVLPPAFLKLFGCAHMHQPTYSFSAQAGTSPVPPDLQHYLRFITALPAEFMDACSLESRLLIRECEALCCVLRLPSPLLFFRKMAGDAGAYPHCMEQVLIHLEHWLGHLARRNRKYLPLEAQMGEESTKKRDTKIERKAALVRYQRVFKPFLPPYKPLRLIPLPKSYEGIFQMLADKLRCVCTVCNTAPKKPVLCLVCGELMCLGLSCCAQWIPDYGSKNPDPVEHHTPIDNVEEQPTGHPLYHKIRNRHFAVKGPRAGELTLHTAVCCRGNGVFLSLKECKIILVSQGMAVDYGSPYVDKYGEMDIGLKRGKPLTLSESRYRDLQQLFSSQTIPWKVVATAAALGEEGIDTDRYAA